MPSIAALCALLGVRQGSSDELNADDLQSPAAYRAALHRALFQRSPGQYPRVWLSSRLGVSPDTCRRYERGASKSSACQSRAAVVVLPAFHSWELHWDGLEKLMPKHPPPGQFIEDQNGRRYPPVIPLARKLLAKGCRLVYKVQDANVYRLAPVQEQASAALHNASGCAEPVLAKQTERVAHSTHPGTSDSHSHKQTPQSALTSTPQDTTYMAPHTAATASKRATAARERAEQKAGAASRAACAQKLYNVLRSANAECSLTRKNAAALVDEYGETLVEKGLKILCQRRNVRNPAGFLRTWLRGEHLRRQLAAARNNTGLPVIPPADTSARARFKDEAEEQRYYEDWLKRLRESPSVHFYMNADQILDTAPGEAVG